MVVALTTAYPRIRPDIWVGLDGPACYDRNLPREAFTKFWRGGYQTMTADGTTLAEWDRNYFVDLAKGGVEDIFTRRDHDAAFVWARHSLGVALHLAVWMGAKNITLVGCDLGGARDYWDDRVLTDVHRAHNRELYRQQVRFLRLFALHGEESGVTLTSATPDSPINEWIPYVPLEDRLAQSAPLPARPVLHSDTAHQMTQLRTDALIVACVLRSGGDYDAEYVERLHADVTAHLSVPHQFVCLTDMPLSIEGVLRVPIEHAGPGWWSKLELFRVLRPGVTCGPVLYLDLDSVVRDSLDWWPQWMEEHADGLAMLPELDGSGALQSGAMSWSSDQGDLYAQYSAAAQKPDFDWHAGDGPWIAAHADAHALPAERFASYKWATPAEKRAASVICYHGQPRPRATGWAMYRPDESPQSQAQPVPAPSGVRHEIDGDVVYLSRDWSAMYPRVWEPGVRAWLHEHLEAGGLFLDIGAHIGVYTLLAAEIVGPSGTVIAFEPSPVAATALRAHVRLAGCHERVHVVEAAVGDRCCMGRLRLRHGGASSANALVADGAECGPDAHALVPIVTLDTVEGRPGCVIKIDVEGAEEVVLAGAAQFITRYRPHVVCSMHGDDDATRRIVALMQAHGYTATVLAPSVHATRPGHCEVDFTPGGA